MRGPTPRATFLPLAILFLFQWFAIGLWNVSFSNVLKQAGLERFIALAFTCNAVAAFASPLLAGSLADRGIPPMKLLRWLYWLAGFWLAAMFATIDLGWGGGSMLTCMQLHSLCYSPCASLLTTIALAALLDPGAEFGPMRMWATAGWMIAGCTVSWVLAADSSVLSGYIAGGVLVALGFATYLLPEWQLPAAARAKNWKEAFGLDALVLLRHPDHRTILLTVTLFGIPLAAFYPYTPLQLTALGMTHPTATMALGQTTEVVALFTLATLLRHVRLKWAILLGLFFGVARYALFAFDTRTALLLGIPLHGACYVLYTITAQIYLAERVERTMQARAQALFAMLTGGVSNLLGYLGTGGWYFLVTRGGLTNWPLFWGGLCATTVAITAYFAWAYHGVGHGFFRRPSDSPVKAG
jgi:MFS family permease